MIFTGTLMQDTPITHPKAVIFFNRDSNKLIVACERNIFITDVSTKSKHPFSGTPWGASYRPHALTLSDDDAVLVAGSPCSVCGYDTASMTRLWIHNTAKNVCAVCMFGAHVLVTVFETPTLVLAYKTGTHIASLQNADGFNFGLGVIEGLCFILSYLSHPLRPPHLSVPRHAAASPLQASQASPSATGDVGLDR